MIATTPISDSGRRLRPGGRTQTSPSGFELTPTLLTMAKVTGERGPEAFDALVPRAIDGDEAAWEALVSRLERVAWRSIAGFDLGSEDRKDAFAATFFRLNERLATIREPAKLPGWVATTARNEVHTLLRSRRRLQTTDPHDLPLAPEPAVGEQRLIADELRSAVRDAFDELSERCRELLRLATVDPPLSYAEIGDVLGMPHGSIGPTRQRCLERLRRTEAMRPYLAGR